MSNMNEESSWKGHLVKQSEDDNVKSLAVQQPVQAFVTWVQRSPLFVRWPWIPCRVHPRLFQAGYNNKIRSIPCSNSQLKITFNRYACVMLNG